MRILVIVLNYGGADETLACLTALEKQTFREFDLYLVENSEKNKEKQIKILRDFLKNHFKKNLAKFDIQPKNTGFAGGVNLGIKFALKNNFDAIALLNSDAVADKNWLENLAKNLPKWDAATGLMLELDGEKIINTGDIYTFWGVPEQRDENLPTKNASKSGEVFGATGGAVLYSAEIFREIGLFDEKLFAYDEDVDIAWRARLAGFRFFYDENARVFHAGGTSSNSNFKTRQVFANLPVVILKNIPAPLIFRILPRFILAYFLFFGYKIAKFQGFSALRGIGRSIKFWPHDFRERKKVMKIFRAKFPTKTSRKNQLKKIEKLMNKKLPFRQIQRVKNFFHGKKSDQSS